MEEKNIDDDGDDDVMNRLMMRMMMTRGSSVRCVVDVVVNVAVSAASLEDDEDFEKERKIKRRRCPVTSCLHSLYKG